MLFADIRHGAAPVFFAVNGAMKVDEYFSASNTIAIQGEQLSEHFPPAVAFMLIISSFFALPTLAWIYFYRSRLPEKSVFETPAVDVENIQKLNGQMRAEAERRANSYSATAAARGKKPLMTIKFMDMHIEDLTTSEVSTLEQALLHSSPPGANVHVGAGCILVTVDVMGQGAVGSHAAAREAIEHAIESLPADRLRGRAVGMLGGVPFAIDDVDGRERPTFDVVRERAGFDAPVFEACARVVAAGAEGTSLYPVFSGARERDVVAAFVVDPNGALRKVAEERVGERLDIPSSALAEPGTMYVRVLRRGDARAVHLSSVVSLIIPIAVVPPGICTSLETLADVIRTRSGDGALNTFLEDIGTLMQGTGGIGSMQDASSRLLEFLVMSKVPDVTEAVIAATADLGLEVAGSVLVNAIVMGELGLFRFILAHGGVRQIGADVGESAGVPGLTPLHIAAVQGTSDFLEAILIEGGAPTYHMCCTLRTNGGQTPLQYATAFGHDPEVVHAFSPERIGKSRPASGDFAAPSSSCLAAMGAKPEEAPSAPAASAIGVQHVLPHIFFLAIAVQTYFSSNGNISMHMQCYGQGALSLLSLLKKLRPRAAPYVAWLGGVDDVFCAPVFIAISVMWGMEPPHKRDGNVFAFLLRHGVLAGLLQTMAASAIDPSKRIAAYYAVVLCFHLYMNSVDDCFVNIERGNVFVESTASAVFMVGLPILTSSRIGAGAKKLKSS